MKNRKDRIDIVNEVLEECILAFPLSSFVISLYQRYQRMGSLSKKQLIGLHSKASKISSLNPAKLATLEAIIKRMPTRYKSEKPPPSPLFTKDENIGRMIDDVLAVNPQHKGVLLLKNKYDNNEPLNAAETSDLKKFHGVVKKIKS
ncbi:MAG: hypothetical protein C5B59_11110 [Bacteroidetes bacterium]|nr:MAG: hypothetical protein C5B59_11110 [Bacteroidota bacterium]